MISSWEGGLNLRLDSTLISTNEGVIYTNCNNEGGVLSPVPLPLLTDIPNVKNFFMYYQGKDIIVMSDEYIHRAEYKAYLYNLMPDGTNTIMSPTTSTVINMGIKAPSIMAVLPMADSNLPTPILPPIKWTFLGLLPIPINIALTTTDAEALEASDEVAHLVDSSNTPSIPKTLLGTYTYVYTYYNSITGAESRPSRLSNQLVISNSGFWVRIDFIDKSTDPQVDTIRVYRLGGTLTNFSMSMELPNETVHFTDEVFDTITDWELAGNRVLNTYNDFPPLANMKYLTVYQAMLFAVIEDKLYFSGIDAPTAWSRTHFLDFEAPITGIGATQHGILVFTKYKTYIVTGTSQSTFSRMLLSGEQGCINHRTIAFIDNTLIWVSTDGICTSNGGAITILTQDKLGLVRLDTVMAIAYDRMYHLVLTDSILVIDGRYNTCVRKLDIHGELAVVKDELLINLNNNLYKLYSDNPSKAIMHYKSGIISFNGYTTYKTNKDIFIAYKGDITIKVWLHTKTSKLLIADKQLPIDDIQFNLKTKHSIAGYGVSYSIVGTGTLYELDFRGSTKDAD